MATIVIYNSNLHHVMAIIVIYNSNLHDKTINTFIGDHSDFVGIAFVDCWDFVGVAFVTQRMRIETN